MKLIIKIIVRTWDFIFYFFGITYEAQANRLNLEELDNIISGPKNEKVTYTVYRANKVSRKT